RAHHPGIPRTRRVEVGSVKIVGSGQWSVASAIDKLRAIELPVRSNPRHRLQDAAVMNDEISERTLATDNWQLVTDN
ncbi:MAG TPA: hypothetical protein VFO46_23550, partial [Candidatus Sulfotelmatobacter sp.]|nr:hypothetical protein [Candidatus Sulfotelmatobacter sp.]